MGSKTVVFYWCAFVASTEIGQVRVSVKNIRLTSWLKFERDLRANITVPKILVRNFLRVQFDVQQDEIDVLAQVRIHGTDRRPGAKLWNLASFDFDHSQDPTPPRPEDITFGYPVELTTPYLVDVSDHYGDVTPQPFNLVAGFDRNTAVAVYDFARLSQAAPYEFTFNGPAKEALLLLMYTARKP